MSLLFLCTGNYYRSRFAEALFNARATALGLRTRAHSRGLATHLVADYADTLSPHTVKRLGALGIPLRHTGARPVQCSNTDLATAVRIVALKEAEHRPLLAALHPGWESRVTYWHVHDIDFAHPDRALPEIETLVAALLATVATEESAALPPL